MRLIKYAALQTSVQFFCIFLTLRRANLAISLIFLAGALCSPRPSLVICERGGHVHHSLTTISASQLHDCAEASSQPNAMQAAACGRWLCERQTLMKADKHHKPVGSKESAGQESISYAQVCTVSHSDIHLEDLAPLRSVGYKRLSAA